MYYTAEIAKKEYPNAVTVFISPCVAKKREARENDNVDYVLNVEELGALFVGTHTEIMDCEEYVDNNEPSKQARNFPRIGGVAESVQHCANCEVCPVVIDGLNKENIRQLKKYAKEGKCAEGNLIEVMCCEGGCINGNATINDTKISKKLLKELSDKSKDIERKD